MQQEHSAPAAILDYAESRSDKPRRWWELATFSAILFVFQALVPRLTPPGWPTAWDYALMTLLPVGSAMMSTTTSLPGWAIGLYGLGAGCTFLFAQLTDTRLHFRLAEPGGVFWFVVNWSAFLFGAWLACRCSVLLRLVRGAQPKLTPD